MGLSWRRWVWAMGIGVAAFVVAPVAAEVLRPVALEAIAYPDDDLWCDCNRQALTAAIDQSLRYLDTDKAAADYQRLQIPGFSRERVRRSLVRFRELLHQAEDPDELQRLVQREFTFYQSVGTDGAGTVDFTAYFEPTYQASPVRTETFRYPLYRRPPGLEQWRSPHPTRLELEGEDGIPPAHSPLLGQELVWLPSRLQAYLVQVQGSGRLQMPDGSQMTVGFDGNTDYPYVSLGKELVNDGIFSLETLTLPKLIEYFETHPEKLSDYIPRNDRFIFFRATNGAPPTGSLGRPVTPRRSIATDKSLMPPGAIALISTPLPMPHSDNNWIKLPRNLYVLDQDTGSAIKGAGRVDLFLGAGENVQTEAGLVNDQGSLYYLLLKE